MLQCKGFNINKQPKLKRYAEIKQKYAKCFVTNIMLIFVTKSNP